MEAEQEGAFRVAKRFDAVLLNNQGHTSGQIATLLKAPRSRVSQWLRDYQSFGHEALLEGHRCGRPPRLDPTELQHLSDIVESGPIAYGYLSGSWTSVMIVQVIQQEFGVGYGLRHVRRLLDKLDCPLHLPGRRPAQVDFGGQKRWWRYTYPNLQKKPRPESQF